MAISKHLLEVGQAEKAVQILTNLIAQNPRTVTAQHIIPLAQYYYNAGNWNDAAQLWRIVTNAEPRNIEALLKLTHCLVEADQYQESGVFLAKAHRILNEEPTRSRSLWNDKWLEAIYLQVCVHFTRNNQEKAAQLVRLCALPASYTESILKSDGNQGSSHRLSEESIRHRIDSACEKFSQSGSTSPFLSECLIRPGESTPWRKGKVLLVMRRHFFNRPDSREHELAFFFRRTAEAVGMEVTFFPAEPFLDPVMITPDEQYAELDRLVRLILTTTPDLVIIDNLCMPTQGGEFIGREVFREVFSELKRKMRFLLVAHYPDAWAPHSQPTIQFVEGFSDVIWQQNSEIKPSRETNRARMFNAPTPYLESVFRNQNGIKDIDGAFVGGVFDYNFPRAIWLTLVRERKLPCEIFLTNHTASGCPAGRSVEEYGSFMSRIKISVDFSSRNESQKIMTGRAWESILSKCLLLEEDNDEIRRFFVPFVHYVPFRNLEELEGYLDFFLRHEDVRQQIVERAFLWYEQRFSMDKIWAGLIQRGVDR